MITAIEHINSSTFKTSLTANVKDVEEVDIKNMLITERTTKRQKITNEMAKAVFRHPDVMKPFE